MNDLILIPFSKHEFKQLILDSVKTAISEIPQYGKPPTTEKDITNLSDSAILLKLSDLVKWIEEGKLKSVTEMRQDLNDH